MSWQDKQMQAPELNGEETKSSLWTQFSQPQSPSLGQWDVSLPLGAGQVTFPEVICFLLL